MSGKGNETDRWHSQPAFPKGLCDAEVDGGIGCRQNPGRVDEFGRIDFTATGPFAAHVGGNDQGILKQDFDVQISLVEKWSGNSCQDQVVLPVPQSRKGTAGRGHLVKMQDDVRELPAKALDPEREAPTK